MKSCNSERFERPERFDQHGSSHRDHPLERNDLTRLLRPCLDGVVFDCRLAHAIGIVIRRQGAVPFLIPTDGVHDETLWSDPVVEPAETNLRGGGTGGHLRVVALAGLDAEHAEIAGHLGEFFLGANRTVPRHEHISIPARDLRRRFPATS